MLFMVKLGYYTFKFNDKNDAVIFGEIAKAHSVEPKDLTVRVEFITEKELEED